jgi:hypothetical protein
MESEDFEFYERSLREIRSAINQVIGDDNGDPKASNEAIKGVFMLIQSIVFKRNAE